MIGVALYAALMLAAVYRPRSSSCQLRSGATTIPRLVTLALVRPPDEGAAQP